jgi:hypothetical protein
MGDGNSFFDLWEPSMGTSHRLPNPVSKEQLINIITVVTCGRFPWKAPTDWMSDWLKASVNPQENLCVALCSF